MFVLRPAVVAACFTALLACSGPTKIKYLSKEPAMGDLSYGEVVYVDDGKCPGGQIKKITGGSDEEGVAREVRCVARPG